jgi:threonine/homoserine/homoserine lactone efflux protein
VGVNDVTELTVFVAQAVFISLSGVMMPGPLTAATLAAGPTRRHAGLLTAVGHGIVEFPLMLLIMAGTAGVVEHQGFRVGVSLAGGVVLLAMGAGALSRRSGRDGPARRYVGRGLVLTGILLSIGNPFFLVWWATAGLKLATQAVRLGVLACGLFALVHWLCDLIWLEVLSLGAFKGVHMLGGRTGRIITCICAAVMLAFGAAFIIGAAMTLFRGG